MNYIDRPVFDYRPNFDDTVDHGLLDDHSYDSQNGGAAIPWKVTTLPKRTLSFSFLLEGLEEIQTFRGFVADRDGRRQGFWIPTWSGDYYLTEDKAADSTTIKVEAVGVQAKLTLSAQFRYLALITKTGLACYRIESVSSSSGVETITLDRGLDEALDASETMCCGLIYARLADDEIEYRYSHVSLVRAAIKFLELPQETDGDAVDGTRPVFLYRFTRGLATYHFTSWPVSVTTTDDTDWTASDIEHGEIRSDIEFAADPVSLDVTTDDSTHPLRDLLSSAVIETTEVEIFETDAGTLTVDFDAPIYKGRLGKVQFGKKGAISCDMTSNLRVGERMVPTVQLARMCQNRLFDPGCALDPAAFLTTGTISAIGDNYVEATAFGDKATAESDANWFALGKVTSAAGEVRLCTGQVGNRLYLNASFRSTVAVVQAIYAQPGCDKRVGTCVSKYDNLENFKGFPYIPNTSPQFEALTAPKPAGGKKG